MVSWLRERGKAVSVPAVIPSNTTQIHPGSRTPTQKVQRQVNAIVTGFNAYQQHLDSLTARQKAGETVLETKTLYHLDAAQNALQFYRSQVKNSPNDGFTKIMQQARGLARGPGGIDAARSFAIQAVAVYASADGADMKVFKELVPAFIDLLAKTADAKTAISSQICLKLRQHIEGQVPFDAVIVMSSMSVAVWDKAQRTLIKRLLPTTDGPAIKPALLDEVLELFDSLAPIAKTSQLARPPQAMVQVPRATASSSHATLPQPPPLSQGDLQALSNTGRW